LRFLIASEKGESKSSSGANTDGSVVDAVVAIGDNEELVWCNLSAARGEDKVVVCVVVVVVTVTVGQAGDRWSKQRKQMDNALSISVIIAPKASIN
jgi:hypothetical protein